MLHHCLPARVLAPAILSLAFLCGCASSDGKGPKLAQVTGRVTFKNEAVTAASIYFMPDTEKGNRGDMATAIIQADGSFTMETYPKGTGVIPGAYKVKFDLGRRPEKELDKYRDVKTTPLSIDVPEQGIKDYVIELK
jgi:hypothetical protein